jgi:hypothetical protein
MDALLENLESAGSELRPEKNIGVPKKQATPCGGTLFIINAILCFEEFRQSWLDCVKPGEAAPSTGCSDPPGEPSP